MIKKKNDLNNEAKQGDQEMVKSVVSADSRKSGTAANIVENLGGLVLVGVLVFVLTLITVICVPTVSAYVHPTMTVDDTEIQTRSSDHNYITGNVSASKGQTIVVREEDGSKVASYHMKDLGGKAAFEIELPKVKEGESKYFVEHIDKNGNPLSKTVSVSVTCKLPKAANADGSMGTNSKLNAIVNKLCWPRGTDKKKVLYASGSPKEAYVEAAKKYLGGEVGEIRRGRRVAFTDCSYFVATVIRMSGVDPKFRALRFDYAKKHEDWVVVSEGKKVDASKLVAGDVIQYKKKGGGNHVIIYLGNKYYAQASRNDQFPVIFMQKRPGHEMYNAAKVNIGSLQVIRNKKIATGDM